MHIRPSFISLVGPGLLTAAMFGCAGPDESIPGGAHAVTGGQGRLDYAAEENGHLYLVDSSVHKRVFGTLVHRGEKIVVDPARNRFVVDGQVPEHAPVLNPDHLYSLYFDRAQ